MSKIVIKNLEKSFGENKVINNFNIDIHDGEFIVLVGPSGCGKSTLLRMVSGLESIDQGEIFLDTKLINNLIPSKREIAMVFQSYALYPHMNVFENMSFGLKMEKISKNEISEKVNHAAATLQIEDLLERKPKQLSGGQRQRVAMGRAIVRSPQAFLMDEPLSNLDAKLRVQMRAELGQLHAQLETTTLYVTHDQVEAMTMGDRVAVIRKGVLQQIDTPREIYLYPKNIFVAGFIGSPKMNLISGEIAAKHSAHTIGIRPEHITITDEESEWSGEVKMSESLGSDTFVHIETKEFNGILTVRADGERRFTRGDKIFLNPKKENMHLFNEKGERI